MKLTRAEQETIIRWDRETGRATVYTADPRVAARWRKLGVLLTQPDAHGWRGEVPTKAVKIRRLENGAIKRVLRPDAGRFLAKTRASLGADSILEGAVERPVS